MLDKSRIENLESVDPDRFRAALLAPKAGRDALHVYYAFHAELAKIPEIVSEPMIGAIRYQWWRDALEEIYTGKPIRQHDIAQPLAGLISAHKIPRFHLDSLVDGRERDLDPEPFADLQAAQNYCRETSGRIMQTAAIILDANANTETIADLGTAWGMTGILRSWRYYENGMLSNIQFGEFLEATETLFSESQTKTKRLEASIVPATAYVSLIPGFLKAMKKQGYDPKTMVPNYGPLAKKWRLMRTALTGKI